MRFGLTMVMLVVVTLAACGDDPDFGADVADVGVRGQDAALRDAGASDVGSTPSPDMGSQAAGAVATDTGFDDPDLPDEPDGEACSVGIRAGTCLPTAECGAGLESVPGHCPGPADIQCCVEIDDSVCDENPAPDDMPQPNAGLTEAPGDAGCPDGMVPVATFCVDRYEASLMEVLPDGSEQPWSPFFNPGNRRVRAVSIAGAVPQAYISGDQAADACAESGKRLCTDAEWLRACQGPGGSTFPYGDSLDPGVCNDARGSHPAVDYFGTTDDSIYSMLDNACIGQQDDTIDRAGANAQCVSADGAFDMMGNLHEWTADPAGTFRGGFYVDTSRNGPGCLYATTAHGSSYWDYSTGFRCCAN